MNTRQILLITTALTCAACAPIHTETVTWGAARRLSNHTADFGHDGGVIRPDLLRAQGVALIIHRATAGGHTDADYTRRERAARVAGVRWGAYHYLKRRMNLEQQIAFFTSTVAKAARRNGTAAYPVLLALDNEGADRMSWRELARAARLTHSRSGAWPLLYCSVPSRGTAAFARQSRELAALNAAERSVLRACGLWVPRYGEQPSTHAQFSVPRVFGDWTFWQYCGDNGGRPQTALVGTEFSGGTGAGFTRDGGARRLRHFCDRSLFNGSHRELLHYLSEHSTAVQNWRQ